MSKSELIQRANQALLAAEANGFTATEKALRKLVAELADDRSGATRPIEKVSQPG